MNKKGFTLIELLVVVLIIGILAAIAVPQYQKAVVKSRFSTLKSLTRSLYEAEKAYFLQNGEYTRYFAKLDLPVKGTDGVAAHPNNHTWCYIEDTYIYCHDYEGIGMAYLIMFGNDKHYCIATSTDALTKEICKAETGKQDPIIGNTWFQYQ